MTRWLSVGLCVLAACSLANREGPNVTCADLGNGATNACEEGILATCIGNEITYRVCDEESVCSQSWQVAGAYRCSNTESTPMPPDVPAAGSGAGTGGVGPTGGSGGAAGSPVGGTGGMSGSGGTGGTGGTGGPATCGLGDLCTIAMASPPGSIQSLAVNGTNVFFATDCGNVWSVPREGGVVTPIVTTSTAACSGGSMGLDATYVYFEATDQPVVRRVPVAGGQVEDVTTTPTPVDSIIADDTAVFWIGGRAIQKFEKATSIGTTLAQGRVDASPLVLDESYLYWPSQFLTDVQRLPKGAASTDVPVSLPLGGSKAADLLARDSRLYFVDAEAGAVGSIDRDAGTVTVIASGLAGMFVQDGPRHIAVNSTHVYWTAGIGIKKAPKDGSGAPTSIATWTSTNSELPIAADEEFVFWAEGNEVKRAPK